MKLPAIELSSTEGRRVALSELETRTVLFVFPSIGGIDDSLLQEWTDIPGARGCTQEACAFRDHLDSFRLLGVDVLGLSVQSPDYQSEAVQRLRLPYPLLSDEQLQATRKLRLPMFEFRGKVYLKRLSLVASKGRIEAALYPVFPPDKAAEQALAWLARNPPA
jgi:peroxiredoxin